MVAIALLLASFGIWVYAYSGAARRPAPDLLDDPTFSTAAEARCARALVELETLPNALDAVDGPDRARQVRATNVIYRTMLDDLDSLANSPADRDSAADRTDRDREITEGWLSDWRVLVDDRDRYAEAIAADPNAQLYVSDVGVAERLNKRVTRMANTNSMPSCIAPEDIG